MRWAGHVACMRNTYSTSIGIPEGKRPLGRSRHRLQEYITMDLREIG
jgi:hypothetical protein